MVERTSLRTCRNRQWTRRIAAPVTTVVKAGRGEVVEAIEGIEAIARARSTEPGRRLRRRSGDPAPAGHHVHVARARNGLVVSYPLQPGLGRRSIGPWVAFVALRQNGAATTVTCRLVTWDAVDGVVRHGDEYRWFLEALAAQLRTVDRRRSPVLVEA